ncbi:Asparagine synthetase [glutamine-hydrolyzing] 1 [bacterium HR36]|nr:Asparagine synthetase [glutamine-hydrolyzing] 1 [bacterium HR36]
MVVTFNGEIYNSPELRQRLQTRGHVFRTRTDTEVLVHLYEEHEIEMVSYLRGMFAFAIWDTKKKRLLLVRDRFGIKPLYYACTTEFIIFGSQPSALLATGMIRPEFDPKAIPSFLYYGFNPAWRCVYQGINKLPPAHYLVWQKGQSYPTNHSYWTVPCTDPVSLSSEAVLAKTRNYIAHAVTSSLLSDVPIGIALSGGLDSSILAYHITTDAELSPLCFTVRWDNMSPKDNEWPLAQDVARQLGFHEQMTAIDPHTTDDPLVAIYRTLDEPLGDTSIVPLYSLCVAARSRVKVLITGDGGDEFFAGYRRYLINLYELRLSRALPQHIIRLLHAATASLDKLRMVRGETKLTRMLKRILLDPGLFYTVSLGQVPLSSIFSWLSPELTEAFFTDLAMLASIWHDAPHQDDLHRMIYCDLHCLLPEALLMKSDRASMSVGLEIRPALLDHDLLGWAMSIPTSHHISGCQTKCLLRRVYRKVLPPSVLKARKNGFHLRGLSEFLVKYVPHLIARLRELTPLAMYLNISACEKSISHFQSGRLDLAQGIWNLFSLVTWYSHWGSNVPHSF